MLPSLLARRANSAFAAATTVRSSLVSIPSVGVSDTNPLVQSRHHPQPTQSSSPFQLQQVRTVTKKRIHRQEKRKRKEELSAKGIFPPKPPNYIPRDTPVINALSKEERNANSRRQDELAAAELQARMQEQKERPVLMRFGFTDDLVMSDRTKKLFDLHNGNQHEVVKAQKQQAMEIFQLREGDTGSSAVQVIALTSRIQQIQTHLRQHKKDKHGKRGLDALYVRRRKLLDYMERKDFDSYRKVVKTLGLIH